MTVQFKPSSEARYFFIPPDLEEFLKFASNDLKEYLVPGLTYFNGWKAFEITFVRRRAPSQVLVLSASIRGDQVTQTPFTVYEIRMEPLDALGELNASSERAAPEKVSKDKALEKIKDFALQLPGESSHH